MSNVLTREQFIRVLPKKMKKNINQELINSINSIIADPIVKEAYRDNLLSYTGIMANGRFKLDSYIDAVRYVSFRLMGATNIVAYTKTFPDRYQRLANNNTSQKDIASLVTAYNKNKLVNLIYEQTLIPSHILNADLYQKALNTQADLMINANSEKVRTDAANSLLTHLKIPETQKIELDIGIKEDKSINDLREATMKLVKQQRLMIECGAMATEEIAHSKIHINDIIEVEFSTEE